MKIAISVILVLCSILDETSQYRFEVPGSRVSIIIPNGTLTSPHYSVMTKPDVFEMSIVEFHGNLDDKYKELDSSEYVRGGVKVYEEYDMEIAGYKGKVVHGNSNPEADFVQFLFGDSTFFIMASTIYTRGDKTIYNDIVKYYKSMVVDKTKIIDWKSFISIRYDEKSPLKLQTDFINPLAIIFKKEHNLSKSYISVQQFPNLGMFPNVETFLSQVISNIFLQSYKMDELISDKKADLNGKSVHQFSAYFTNNQGERHLIHCTARLTDDLASMIFAIVMNPNDEKEFKDFFKTIEFKN